MVVLDAEGSGRVDLDCLCYLLLLLCGEAADLCLEIALLDSRRAQGRVEILADLTGALRDAANVLDVSLVLRVLPAGRTAAQPDDEQDDRENEKGDQPGQTEHRDEALRGSDRPARATRWAPGAPHALRRLFGLGLVEEVEFDV